jgi:hypothetical protein
MTEIIPALIKHCGNDATITAAFGARIFGNLIPDLPGGGAQPYPYARMQEIATSNRYTHQGNSGRVVLVQIDVYDDDESGANANAELIRNLFDGYKGMIGGTVNAGMVKARRVSGTWNETARNFWRILEVQVSTND